MAYIAVTGASGFLGRHLIPMALAEGHQIRGMARHPSEPGAVSGTAEGFEFITGDVRRAEDVRALLTGCDTVVLLAPGFDPDPQTTSSITGGAESVLAEAKGAGIQRIVYLSCLGADAASASPFYAARWEAEMRVRSAGVPFAILRPSLILGRGDGVVDALAAAVRDRPVVPVPGKGDHRVQPIDVNDVARCILQTITGDAVQDDTVSVGGTIFITFRQMIDLVGGVIGVARSKLLLPYRFLPAVIPLLPERSRPLYRPPRLAQFSHGVVASPGIVEATFGFTPADVLGLLPSYIP